MPQNRIHRERLEMVLRPNDTAASLFKSNLAVKLLSLALAISVWGFTALSRESRQELILPVEVLNSPSGYVPNRQYQGEIAFTLSGPAVWLRSAKQNNRKISLNLNGAAAPGKTLFSNLEKNLNLHQSVRVIRTSPASLEIELIGKPENKNQGEQHK
jgi:hypothetical protein